MITLTREYTIPHYDNDWLLLQMKHITVWVTVSQEPGETEQQVKDNLEKLYQEQVAIAESKSPTARKYKKQLNTLIKEIQAIPNINPTVIQWIIKKVKDITN